MFIIAGLGNPTRQYEGTRHNVGFDVIDALADKYNIAVDGRKCRAFVGKGIIEGQKVLLVKPQTYMNLSGESVRGFVEYYKVMKEDELLEAKKALLVATSKPEVFARKILEYLKLADYFSGIYGANLDGSRTKKAEVISYALMSQKVTDVSKAVMVGDREHDILGAKKVGIDGIGVLFGYGNYEELYYAKADKIAKDTEEVFSFIMDSHV